MTILYIIIALYVILALVVANAGRYKTPGFWLTLIFSLVFTPAIGAITTALSKYKCIHCGYESKYKDGLCKACGKDDKGKTKEDYQSRVK